MTDPSLVVDAIDVDYFGTARARRSAQTAVLRRVSLRVQAREVVAVVGPSGCGKSTLLRLLAGYELASSGTVQILGTDIATLSPNRRATMQRDRIGSVWQSFDLIPSLTAFDNVALPARLARRKWDHRNVHDALAAVGMTPHARRRPAELSGGERQRVAVARVLARRPELVLADEPTSALDPESATRVLSCLRSLASRGSAVIVVTHDPHVAAMTDRVVMMRDGRIHHDIGRATAGQVLEAIAWPPLSDSERS